MTHRDVQILLNVLIPFVGSWVSALIIWRCTSFKVRIWGLQPMDLKFTRDCLLFGSWIVLLSSIVSIVLMARHG